MTIQAKTRDEWVQKRIEVAGGLPFSNRRMENDVDFLIASGVLPVAEPKSVEQEVTEYLGARGTWGADSVIEKLKVGGFRIVRDGGAS
jgi:hypothetical protein